MGIGLDPLRSCHEHWRSTGHGSIVLDIYLKRVDIVVPPRSLFIFFTFTFIFSFMSTIMLSLPTTSISSLIPCA
jgi:hypothetical protein